MTAKTIHDEYKAILAYVDAEITRLQALRESLVAFMLSQGWHPPLHPQKPPASKSTHPTSPETESSLWPTPSSRDWKDTPGMATEGPDGRNRTDQLARRVYSSLTPLPVQVGGQLNPTWVEWLMGFPTAWTDLRG